MSRPLRIEYPGAVHHVTSRGNRREAVFKNEDERHMFYEVLASVVRDYNWACHADCQMGNHYHAVVETPDANLSEGMRQLNGVFTQRLNRARKTVGHVFQGRFASRLIGTDEYFLEACRYTVLNPVRARMREGPGDWRWSSYLGTAGLAPARAFQTTTKIRRLLSAGDKSATTEYRRFIVAGIGSQSPFASATGAFAGNAALAAAAIKPPTVTTNTEVPRQARLVGRPRLDDVLSRAAMNRAHRNDAIREAWTLHAYTMAEIARALGIHYATVSRIVRNAPIGEGRDVSHFKT